MVLMILIKTATLFLWISVSSHPFTPTKLCAAVDEAKVHAAEHTLQTLGLQTEGAADASCAAAAAVASVAFPGM